MGLRVTFFLLFLLGGVAAAKTGEGPIPSHDKALIDSLASEDSDTRINAALALAERKRSGTLNAHAEAEIRRLFTARVDGSLTTAFPQREAIAIYYGEIVPLMDSGEWNWLVQHYTEEPDTGVRIMLAHSLGEIAHAHSVDGSSEATIRRREIIWKAACAHHLEDIGKRHPSPP